MSAATESPDSQSALAEPPETHDAALIRCEHDRATLARTGKPLGLVFDVLDRDNA